MTPHNRIRRALEVAHRIADARDPLGVRARQRLVALGTLSEAGVELALSQHLETSVSDRDLASFVQRSTPAPRCHVMLAANVCTAALRAVAHALAVAAEVYVRPSRRDPVLAELLCEQLDGVHLVAELAPAAHDEVHLYGSDESIAELRASLPPDVRVKAHGSGMGAAVIDTPSADAATLLARDLAAFDGAGCLSPRFVFAPDAVAFGARLNAALVSLARDNPRGTLPEQSRSALAQYARTMAAVGHVHVTPHHLVAIDPEPNELLLPPVGRAICVVEHRLDAQVAHERLGSLARFVTCVAGQRLDPPTWRRLWPHVRVCELGRMQQPPFDGPVDLR